MVVFILLALGFHILCMESCHLHKMQFPGTPTVQDLLYCSEAISLDIEDCNMELLEVYEMPKRGILSYCLSVFICACI